MLTAERTVVVIAILLGSLVSLFSAAAHWLDPHRAIEVFWWGWTAIGLLIAALAVVLDSNARARSAS